MIHGSVSFGSDCRVEIEDNSEEVLRALGGAVTRILTIWGMKIEGWAKRLCPVGTAESTGKKGYRGGTLRNSITFEVDAHAQILAAGTNVECGPYVELGTGPYFTPPPEWENFEVPPASGIGHSYVKARPFLRPAVLDHTKQLQEISVHELNNA